MSDKDFDVLQTTLSAEVSESEEQVGLFITCLLHQANKQYRSILPGIPCCKLKSPSLHEAIKSAQKNLSPYYLQKIFKDILRKNEKS